MVKQLKFYVTVVTRNKCWKLFSANKGVIDEFIAVSFQQRRGTCRFCPCVWILCASSCYRFRDWEINYNRRNCKFSPSCGSIRMRCGSSCSLLFSLFVISLMGISNSHFAEIVRRHRVPINPALHENLSWREQITISLQYALIDLRCSLWFIIFTFLSSFFALYYLKITQPPFQRISRSTSPRVKLPEREDDNLHVVSKLRISEFLPPFLHASS
jgi:hypothetical protein